MQALELDGFGSEDWNALIDGERHPWGGTGEALAWQDKERHVGIHGEAGRLVAAGGLALARVEIGRSQEIEVVGVGGVIVHRALRGRGLATMLLDRLLAVAATMGPDRAMLFCRPELLSFYERLGFREIAGPVRAAQPAGDIEMPMRSAWRPLRGSPGWPEGSVRVCGLPF
jgi:GNAT superfamily N-acetyltransferase